MPPSSAGWAAVKWLKFLIAVLLLPACVAVTLCAWQMAWEVAFGSQAMTGPLGWAFFGGYGLWLAVFAFLPKPMRTYVLGHELTHAVWALMMGARVSGLKVGKAGGQVKTSKVNWLITLAPYFFPFYAVLFAGLFLLAHAIWGLEPYWWVLFFLVGLGWSFHVTFTLMTLLTVSQPDVKSQGVLFSAVVIYCMNLLTIGLTIALMSHGQWKNLGTLVLTLGSEIVNVYGWTLSMLLRIIPRP